MRNILGWSLIILSIFSITAVFFFLYGGGGAVLYIVVTFILCFLLLLPFMIGMALLSLKD